MGKDALDNRTAALRDAMEKRARTSLASRPDAPIEEVHRESLLATFSDVISRAVPGSGGALGAADVYGGLVGLNPCVDRAGVFHLRCDDGTRRKHAGAYYTPPPLVELILRSTLDP